MLLKAYKVYIKIQIQNFFIKIMYMLNEFAWIEAKYRDGNSTFWHWIWIEMFHKNLPNGLHVKTDVYLNVLCLTLIKNKLIVLEKNYNIY